PGGNNISSLRLISICSHPNFRGLSQPRDCSPWISPYPQPNPGLQALVRLITVIFWLAVSQPFTPLNYPRQHCLLPPLAIPLRCTLKAFFAIRHPFAIMCVMSLAMSRPGNSKKSKFCFAYFPTPHHSTRLAITKGSTSLKMHSPFSQP